MSKVRVAALVCEGQTDVPILKEILHELLPELETVRCLQPELDETDRAKGAAGWTQVRSWCERNADDLDEVLHPLVGDPIDLLLIVIDVDIAIEAGIANPPTRLGVYETKRLRDTMIGWLSVKRRSKLPSAVVLSTPVTSVEAWVVAALFPKQSNVESITLPAEFLVKKGKLKRSPKDDKPWKELHLYRDTFAPIVAKKLKRVRSACSEADRTIRAIEDHVRQLG